MRRESGGRLPVRRPLRQRCGERPEGRLRGAGPAADRSGRASGEGSRRRSHGSRPVGRGPHQRLACHGRPVPRLWSRSSPVFGRAFEIIESAADLVARRALEMPDADLRKRARLLDRPAWKWRAPNPKPRDRRLVRAPEPLLFESGGRSAYPTQRDNAANVHPPATRRAEARRLALEKIGSFEPDRPALRAAVPQPHQSLDRSSWSLSACCGPAANAR